PRRDPPPARGARGRAPSRARPPQRAPPGPRRAGRRAFAPPDPAAIPAAGAARSWLPPRAPVAQPLPRPPFDGSAVGPRCRAAVGRLRPLLGLVPATPKARAPPFGRPIPTAPLPASAPPGLATTGPPRRRRGGTRRRRTGCPPTASS